MKTPKQNKALRFAAQYAKHMPKLLQDAKVLDKRVEKRKRSQFKGRT